MCGDVYPHTHQCVLGIRLSMVRRGSVVGLEACEREFYFSSCLMFILLSHELGLLHRCQETWFFAIPSLFSTLSFRVWNIGRSDSTKSMPSNRNALLEMGAAGPIAGFVAAIFTACIGMPFTETINTLNFPLHKKRGSKRCYSRGS